MSGTVTVSLSGGAKAGVGLALLETRVNDDTDGETELLAGLPEPEAATALIEATLVCAAGARIADPLVLQVVSDCLDMAAEESLNGTWAAIRNVLQGRGGSRFVTIPAATLNVELLDLLELLTLSIETATGVSTENQIAGCRQALARLALERLNHPSGRKL